ncbi:hypothetical protein [Amphritea japonica]|uniref:Uncharacterized protein n=1 Tax=Amphritea japonica ATCC BAA-1530 TaxID=1278309 RepID=A0A7R6STN0_9GAMM|nr:hypothetical protein [Amphritea japonica]BBB27475.1 conserved hypothetical protein [Amphritea japonica ATCC BAA-1530]
MNHPRLRDRLRLRLIRRADKVKQNLIILLIGLGIFLLGFVTLIIAQFLIPEGLQRELIALIGLILAICGVITAAFGYISLSILRIFRFLLTETKRPDQSHD